MKIVRYVFAGLLAVGFLVGLYSVLTFTPRGQAKPLPNVVLENRDGDPVALREITNGKVALINVWASWCPYCTQELPDFARLKKQYSDIEIIAVNRKESKSAAESYLHSQGVAESLTVLFDEKDDFYRAINGVGMPETVIVDSQGNVVMHRHGPMTFDEMEAAVRATTTR